MNRRPVTTALILVFMAGHAGAQGAPMVFAVNEGVTYRVNPGAPDEDSITSVLMRATLQAALEPQLPEFTDVKLQDAVPFMVEHGMVAAGVSASRAVVKDWQNKGGRVMLASQPVPIKHLIVNGKLSEAERRQLSAYFVGLEQSPEGKKRLEALNVPGFVEFDRGR